MRTCNFTSEVNNFWENVNKSNKQIYALKAVPFSKSLKTFDKFLTSSVGILYLTRTPKYSTSTAVGNNPMI